MSRPVFPGTELAERVGVMGVSTNMVTYLVGPLHLSNARSANIVTNFMGTLNLLAFLGGFVADAKLGRYHTIAASATVATTVRESSTCFPSSRDLVLWPLLTLRPCMRCFFFFA